MKLFDNSINYTEKASKDYLSYIREFKLIRDTLKGNSNIKNNGTE